MDEQEVIKRLEEKLGLTSIPTPGAVISWFAAKSPEGILVISIACNLFATSLWILGYAFKSLGWFQ